MNGMKRKAQERERARRYTPEGLPRDPLLWTVEDWRDLHNAIEEVKRKVAARHRKVEKP